MFVHTYTKNYNNSNNKRYIKINMDRKSVCRVRAVRDHAPVWWILFRDFAQLTSPLPFLGSFVFFICMNVLSRSIYTHMFMQHPGRPEKGIRSHETGVR